MITFAKMSVPTSGIDRKDNLVTRYSAKIFVKSKTVNETKGMMCCAEGLSYRQNSNLPK